VKLVEVGVAVGHGRAVRLSLKCDELNCSQDLLEAIAIPRHEATEPREKETPVSLVLLPIHVRYMYIMIPRLCSLVIVMH
jgi:hypothetical protein